MKSYLFCIATCIAWLTNLFLFQVLQFLPSGHKQIEKRKTDALNLERAMQWYHLYCQVDDFNFF